MTNAQLLNSGRVKNAESKQNRSSAKGDASQQKYSGDVDKKQGANKEIMTSRHLAEHHFPRSNLKLDEPFATVSHGAIRERSQSPAQSPVRLRRGKFLGRFFLSYFSFQFSAMKI